MLPTLLEFETESRLSYVTKQGAMKSILTVLHKSRLKIKYVIILGKIWVVDIIQTVPVCCS